MHVSHSCPVHMCTCPIGHRLPLLQACWPSCYVHFYCCNTDLDREVLALKREEEKLIREIKAAAKTNNQASLKILAKSLVRLRAQIAKLHGSAANLKGVSTNLTVRGCVWIFAAVQQHSATASVLTLQAVMHWAAQQVQLHRLSATAATFLARNAAACKLYQCDDRTAFATPAVFVPGCTAHVACVLSFAAHQCCALAVPACRPPLQPPQSRSPWRQLRAR